MLLTLIDWLVIGAYMLFTLFVGLWVMKKSGTDSTEFFAAGKNMPWWLLGISMVATTFSTDTPNLVTDIVRQNGVAGNWTWWAFLLSGMMTVFIYAHLWKRSGILTDVEFYELRYSGKPAAFLRGFRAIYLGLIFNVIIMASVSLAAIKLGTVIMGLTPLQTILIAGTITVIYSALGGLRSVLITDFFQFFLAILGGFAAAYVALTHPDVGGFSGLFSNADVRPLMNMLPDFSDSSQLWAIFIIPLAVQWWSVYYPGAEPGGGGYVAQRMLAAKNENNAVGAVFIFNALHYALRPWPWIIVGLCSVIVFPSLDSISEAFPHASGVVGHDMGYPAMLTFLPVGWMGIVIAGLIAAYMSTISTHLNWGSSYIVHDFYRRFVRPKSTEKELVNVGRVSTVVLMILAGWLALAMTSALDNFQIILQIGAGTGLIFILRWFWWRVNAWSEISAMIVSFLIALYFRFWHASTGLPVLNSWQELLTGVVITTIVWVMVTYLTRPTSEDTLVSFCMKIRPGGPGWVRIREMADRRGVKISDIEDKSWRVPQGIYCMVLGCIVIYGILLATGYWIYGNILPAAILTVIVVIASFALKSAWLKMAADTPEE
ncbi:MAG TPA: sodium:solute symporter family protein [Balneolaceae bacterium]|nr:sodium:solute symporter family protein [Balneolaceae bacterium]